MFTGIVEDIGQVVLVEPRGAVVRLTLDTMLDLSDTQLGDSIAVDGVCLTVTERSAGAPSRVSFDVGPESLRVTALRRLTRGTRVHLERALRLSDRLGGHLVQGHVDGVGTVASRRREGDTLQLRIDAPTAILRLCIPKGSIAIDGVSLTLNALDAHSFEVWLIPHTLERTHLGERRVGDVVNLENDLVGKYVARLLPGGDSPTGVSLELLARHGFLGA